MSDAEEQPLNTLADLDNYVTDLRDKAHVILAKAFDERLSRRRRGKAPRNAQTDMKGTDKCPAPPRPALLLPAPSPSSHFIYTLFDLLTVNGLILILSQFSHLSQSVCLCFHFVSASFFRLSVYLPACLSACLYLSVPLSLFVCFCFSVCLSVSACLFVCVSTPIYPRHPQSSA